ncbi:MAG: hypothetical protein JSR90_23320 [Proteobacteria bacterium]|nr:hypothetical protein [Pseudomonadota bacterium]
MTDRTTALARVAVGDILYAEDEAGPTRICLTIDVTPEKLTARSVTTQHVYEFDRRTGVALHRLHGIDYTFVIKSVAPLPADIHEIMLGLDRRYGGRPEKGDEPASGDTGLTEEQKRGLLYVSSYYPAFPI